MQGRSVALRAVVTLLAPVAFLAQFVLIIIKDDLQQYKLQNGAALADSSVKSPLVSSGHRSAIVDGEQTQVRKLVRVEAGVIAQEEELAFAASHNADPAVDAHKTLCRALQAAHARGGLEENLASAAAAAMLGVRGRPVCA
mmetsp:Transcript_31630/g.75862  ORF Transcript_31630/g.75862 Transcript_31630/m.75862 type:complete len:141 (+) Transcript_31630:160-582(+)